MENLSVSAKSAQSQTRKNTPVKTAPKKDVVVLLPLAPEEPKTEVKEPTPTTASAQPTTKKTIQELTDSAERLYLLKQKYSDVKEKRKQLEQFAISHDNNNAQLTLVDANGLKISTSNPTSIKNLLDDWAKDLATHLLSVEASIRQEIAQLN